MTIRDTNPCTAVVRAQFGNNSRTELFSFARSKRTSVPEQVSGRAQFLHVCALGDIATVTVYSGCSRLLIAAVMRPGGRPEQLDNMIWEQLGAVEEQLNS